MSDNEKDWLRLSSKRKDEITESMLSALATLETVQGRMPPDVPPPIYVPKSLGTGVTLSLAPVRGLRSINDSVLLLPGWGTDGGGQAQVQCYRARWGGGHMEGLLTALFLRRRRTVRLDLAFRGRLDGDISVRGPQAPWRRGDSAATHVRFSIETICALREHEREHPALFLGIDDLAIQLPCTDRFARLLLSGRDKVAGRGRRAALRHFVDHYFRDQEAEAGDDEVWVRKHLRGAVECEWGGFVALLRPPAAWQEEHDDWKEARDVYRNMSPEDRAAARDLIRTTYGLPPKGLTAAMRGD